MPEQCHQPKAMSLERADDGQDSGGTNWWGEGPEEDSAAPTMGGVSSRALWGQGMSREHDLSKESLSTARVTVKAAERRCAQPSHNLGRLPRRVCCPQAPRPFLI